MFLSNQWIFDSILGHTHWDLLQQVKWRDVYGKVSYFIGEKATNHQKLDLNCLIWAWDVTKSYWTKHLGKQTQSSCELDQLFNFLGLCVICQVAWIESIRNPFQNKWMFSKIRNPPIIHFNNVFGFSIINHPFWGTPICGNTQIQQKLTKSPLTSKNPLTFRGSFLQDFHICHSFIVWFSVTRGIATKLNVIQKSMVFCFYLSVGSLRCSTGSVHCFKQIKTNPTKNNKGKFTFLVAPMITKWNPFWGKDQSWCKNVPSPRPESSRCISWGDDIRSKRRGYVPVTQLDESRGGSWRNRMSAALTLSVSDASVACSVKDGEFRT